MSIKEQVLHALDDLNDAELEQVAEYLAFLKFRARLLVTPSLDAAHIASLYKEFAEEDRQLAEEGIEEYAQVLLAEDTR